MDPKTRSKLSLGAGLIIGGLLVARLTIFTAKTTPYSRGQLIAAEQGCLACHWEGASELTAAGAPQPSLPGEEVPPLIGCELSHADFSSWVLNGRPEGAQPSSASTDLQGPQEVVMPAYKNRLNAQDVSDLHAWSLIEAPRAHVKQGPDYGRLAEAERLAVKHGCFFCHGKLGQGGVNNPGSLTGEIPALTGDDFDHLCDDSDPAAVEEWIRTGRSERFLSGSPFSPVGRWFMDRQLTKMPAYDETLSDDEVDLLVEYCLHLGNLGPMDPTVYASHQVALNTPSDPELTTQPAAPSITDDSPRLPPAVAELFSQHCIRCHGPKKQKSDYRMDTKEAAFALGEIAEFLETSTITPGDPKSSLLVTFLLAEEEDPENEIFPMPPDEEDRFTPEQITLISEWVAAGAPWHESQELQSTYTD
ncbi:MAG: hypothetical protein CL933_01065 [Deltaproteobacteria bacterium]|nr:hypothetical protein [Deltaproteobacteria bacterium]